MHRHDRTTAHRKRFILRLKQHLRNARWGARPVEKWPTHSDFFEWRLEFPSTFGRCTANFPKRTNISRTCHLRTEFGTKVRVEADAPQAKYELVLQLEVVGICVQSIHNPANILDKMCVKKFDQAKSIRKCLQLPEKNSAYLSKICASANDATEKRSFRKDINEDPQANRTLSAWLTKCRIIWCPQRHT